MTALTKSIVKGHWNIVKIFLSKGTYVGVEECGYSPLHVAAFCGHQNIVEELILSGSNPDSKDKDGNSPTNLAFKEGYKQICDFIRQFQTITY